MTYDFLNDTEVTEITNSFDDVGTLTKASAKPILIIVFVTGLVGVIGGLFSRMFRGMSGGNRYGRR